MKTIGLCNSSFPLRPSPFGNAALWLQKAAWITRHRARRCATGLQLLLQPKDCVPQSLLARYLIAGLLFLGPNGLLAQDQDTQENVERAVTVAKKAQDQATREADQEKRTAEKAAADARRSYAQAYSWGGGGSGGNFQPFAYGSSHRARPLVVRTSDGDAKEVADLEEDLVIMSHILGKAVSGKFGSRSRSQEALGIHIWTTPNSSAPRSIYLEGYGALFLMNVGFPLVASPKTESHKEKSAEDSDWEEARREVYGRPPAGKTVTVAAEEYEAEKVEKLKDSLIEALKNAANLHGLKPDEYITVCVSGGGGGDSLKVVSTAHSGASAGAITRTAPVAPIARVSRQGATLRGSVMTIRVRKSDADAFAKEKLSLEEFRKKARFNSYLASVGEGDHISLMNGDQNSFGFWFDSPSDDRPSEP
jgi:hypothetical protein